MTDIKITPVTTEFSKYDVLRIDQVETPFDQKVTVVSLVDTDDVDFPDGQLISANFASVPENSFAYNPDSYCDATIPQLVEQGVIVKSPMADLHSGFNTYPVYKLSDDVISELK